MTGHQTPTAGVLAAPASEYRRCGSRSACGEPAHSCISRIARAWLGQPPPRSGCANPTSGVATSMDAGRAVDVTLSRRPLEVISAAPWRGYAPGVQVEFSNDKAGSRLRQIGDPQIAYDWSGSRPRAPGQFALDYDRMGHTPPMLRACGSVAAERADVRNRPPDPGRVPTAELKRRRRIAAAVDVRRHAARGRRSPAARVPYT